MKKRLTLLSMLAIAIVALGQEPAIVFETTKNPISLSIKASNNDPAAQEQVWIDLNGNGELDEGEKVTTFGSQVEYNITTTTVRVFGPVWVFNCQKNEITSLDVSGAATTLNQLTFSNNQITSLDLSMMEKLSSNTTGTGVGLESLRPSPVQARLNIYSNKIGLEAMTTLVNELPDRTGKTPGSITLWYGTGSVNGKDQNQLSQELYEKLVAKNWVVKTAIPNEPYEGPFDTETTVDKLTSEKEIIIQQRDNGILVTAQEVLPIRIYTISGQLLYKEDSFAGTKFFPIDKKGIYLINSNKIVF